MSNTALPPQAAPASTGLQLRVATFRRPAHRLPSGAAAIDHHSFRSVPELHLVRRSDPAVRVMTDFAQTPAFTVTVASRTRLERQPGGLE